MKKRYTTLLLLFFSLTSFSQTSPIYNVDSTNAVNIKPLFEYLMTYRKLNIAASDNVTVQQLVNDAISAGYNINVAAASLLQNNLSKPFYTITPSYVRYDGMIVAPKDSSYKAMLGDAMIVFSRSNTGFEDLGGSFQFLRRTVNNQLEYTQTDLPQFSYDFTIHHFTDGTLPLWYVVYTNNLGYLQKQWFTAADTLVTITGTGVQIIQDADTVNRLYAAAYTETTQAVNGTVIDTANYYRPTAAVLQIMITGGKGSRGTAMTVAVMQNPSTGSFRFNVGNTSNAQVNLSILDANGRVMELQRVNGGYISAGENLKPGLYFAAFTQGNQRQVIKLVKL